LWLLARAEAIVAAAEELDRRRANRFVAPARGRRTIRTAIARITALMTQPERSAEEQPEVLALDGKRMPPYKAGKCQDSCLPLSLAQRASPCPASALIALLLEDISNRSVARNLSHSCFS
jgi:hypothetical protein